ncbi:glycosyltransferase family 2 protein [Nostoc sp.]|uniref:glycosyltransferase family 2 protein n=1 Tax=Nostoc sp. TaxID=1180 RepID=UPI0035947FB7
MTLKNKPTKIIQIVPQLPPSINGVGDYALNLARQLGKDCEIETHFIVGTPYWQGATTIQDFPIQRVVVRSAEALFFLLSTDSNQSASVPTSVLLHYVGYGYANRGCPAWLVEGLERWKANTANSRLLTMFHEVAASGPPWTSAFWLSPLQRNLAARLAHLSDRCLTSKQHYAEILSKLSQGKQTQVPTLPVFSTVGELEQALPLAERSRRIVVFGSCGNRLRVYQESLVELSYTCQLLGIKEILDIGTSTGLTLSLVNGVPVVEMGALSASEISDILSTSLAGFFNYNLEYLAKSTIFAAYCAHGLLPVSPRSHALPVDGILARKHYWIADDMTTGLRDLLEVQAIADNAYNWYQTHNLSLQARTFATYLTGDVATELGAITEQQSNYQSQKQQKATMNITISALVTNYNTWPLTTRCVQELKRWSNKSLVEILVVDDASEQPIPEHLPDNVRVVRNNHNCGYVASVNTGFLKLSEDVVILLDSDAYPLTDLTESISHAFTANPKLGALGFQLVDQQHQPTGSSQADPDAIGLLLGQRMEGLYQSRFNSTNPNNLVLYSCAMAVRRTAFEDVGGFDKGFDFLDADIDFSLGLRAAGWHVQIDPSLTVFHEGGGSFQATSTRVLRYHRNRWRLLAKHGHLPQPWLFKAGLATRHAFEYAILQIGGKRLVPESEILADKLHGRQQLIREVWSGYGNEH